MATRTAVSRLAERVDALAARRGGRLTLECITDEAWTRLEHSMEQLEATLPNRVGRTGCEHLTDDQLVRRMIELGGLTWDDVKPR